MSNYLEPQIVELKKLGMIDHPGLRLMVAGQLVVIHNSFSAGKVVMSLYEDYAQGHEVVESVRFQPLVSTYQMEENARSLLGKPWKPWYNCQHFITEIAGLKSRSWQLENIAASILLCSVLVVAYR